VQKYLNELKEGYKLIIFDAARPHSVQQYMWDSSGVSNSQKINYLSNPAMGSIHNYGCAVDISILDNKGKALDMGTSFDCMDIASGTANELELLKQGKLTQQQIDNRILLRKVMAHAGFFNVQSEWWHFNFCSIQIAKSKYKIIE
jgi:zinc D-Ala-D-Ala dipeptidase